MNDVNFRIYSSDYLADFGEVYSIIILCGSIDNKFVFENRTVIILNDGTIAKDEKQTAIDFSLMPDLNVNYAFEIVKGDVENWVRVQYANVCVQKKLSCCYKRMALYADNNKPEDKPKAFEFLYHCVNNNYGRALGTFIRNMRSSRNQDLVKLIKTVIQLNTDITPLDD